MKYLTTAEFAAKWGIIQRRVTIYCKEGRIEGAELKGRTWLIPEDTKKQMLQDESVKWDSRNSKV